MADNALASELREGIGKGVARKLRAAGRVPGTLYGPGKTPTSIALDPRALERILKKSAQGRNTLIDLTVSANGSGSSNQVVLIKDMQREPLSGSLIHVDLYALDLSQMISVEVPIHVIGTPVGVQVGGGILDHPLRTLEIECLPHAIPEALEVEAGQLDLGDSIHVRDVPLPTGVTLKTDEDLTVISVVAPKAEVEETPVVEGEGEEGAEVAEGAAAPTEGAGAEGGGDDS